MTVTQLLVWMQVAEEAIPAGIATINTIKGWITASHTAMTDAELNAALALVGNDAARRMALALTVINPVNPPTPPPAATT